MATGGEPGHIHPKRTTKHEYEYFFSDKHHGRGGPDVARWALDLNEQEEFEIFDRAVESDLSDDHGNLYGLRIGPTGEILELGTWHEQVARFPRPPSGPWHGYPLGPLKKPRQPHPPLRSIPTQALQKMEQHHLLTAAQRKRLQKGGHV